MKNKNLNNIEKPIFFTITTCILVYLYLSFENKKINKNNRKNKKKKRRKVDIIPIIITGIVTFFLSYNYMCPENTINKDTASQTAKNLDSILNGGYNNSSDSFQLIEQSNYTGTKPDVFLDIVDF